MSTRDLVLSMFQRIDTLFDLIVIQSEKPMVMIRWVDALCFVSFKGPAQVDKEWRADHATMARSG